MHNNRLLTLLILLVTLLSLFFSPSTTEKELFRGTDNQAVVLIENIQPDYTPWFDPLWTPPGGSVESFLFALQAALGSGILGFYLGRRSGRRQCAKKETDVH